MRRRLALVTFAVTAMVIVAFVVPLGLLVREQARDRALARAERDAQAVASALSVADALTGGMVTGDLADLVVGSAAGQPERVTVFLADGSVAGAAADAGPGVERARTGTAFSAEVDEGIEVLVPVSGPSGTTVVRSLATGSDLRRGVWTAWSILGLLGLLLIAVALAVSDRLARSVVRPVRGLAGAAHRLAAGELDAKVQPDGPPEVAEVGEAFNYLAGRLENLIAAERESIADLSHRLRTPLTALRLQAEALGESEETAAIVADIERMQRSVDRLIADARRSTRDARPAADLAGVTTRQVAFWSVLAEEQDRAVTAQHWSEPLPVQVAEADLVALVDVLIENVFSHTAPGTGFTVLTSSSDSSALLVVEDEGPGFPAESVTARGESGSGSTGLGLDIVLRTAEAAGGGMRIGAGGRGGARVEVWFQLL